LWNYVKDEIAGIQGTAVQARKQNNLLASWIFRSQLVSLDR
jgi:hypothetical protein